MAVKSSDFISFNDGICAVYSVENAAEEGDTPVEKLIEKYRLRFRWHTVGMSRFYEAMQAQVKITNAVDVPLRADIDPQDVVIIDGRQYRIEQVQQRRDSKPPTLLLSLSDIDEVYEL